MRFQPREGPIRDLLPSAFSSNFAKLRFQLWWLGCGKGHVWYKITQFHSGHLVNINGSGVMSIEGSTTNHMLSRGGASIVPSSFILAFTSLLLWNIIAKQVTMFVSFKTFLGHWQWLIVVWKCASSVLGGHTFTVPNPNQWWFDLEFLWRLLWSHLHCDENYTKSVWAVDCNLWPWITTQSREHLDLVTSNHTLCLLWT